MNKNKFYNRSAFQLAEVEFSPRSPTYTFAVLSKWEVKRGEYLVVPVSTFRTFSDPNAHQNMKLVKVVKVGDFKNVDHDLKMAVQKIDSRLYTKVAQLRSNHIKKHRS